MLEKKLEEYFTNKKEVIAVYLFGSYAEGKMYRQSDIDIGILFDETSRHHMKEKRNTYMRELSRILREDIHPTILSSKKGFKSPKPSRFVFPWKMQQTKRDAGPNRSK